MPASRSPNPNPNLDFDLIFICGRVVMMDSPCAKFGVFSFSCFGFFVRTDRQTDRQRRMIAALLYSRKYGRHE